MNNRNEHTAVIMHVLLDVKQITKVEVWCI